MAIEIQDGFRIPTAVPIDSRFVKANIAQRNAIPAEERYEGLPCYVVEEGKTYYLAGGVSNANWSEIGSGGVPTLAYYPDCKPILNLDFANTKTLDPRITYERAFKATRINEFGLIEEVGANVPRFDHDPETLECKGLLIEESRTNLLTHSNQFDDAYWWKLQASVIPYASNAPDGSLTMSKIVPDVTDNHHLIRPSTLILSAEDGKEYTVSAFARAGGYDRFRLSFETTSWVGGVQPAAILNLSTGVVYGASASVTSHTVRHIGNGVYRFSITVKAVGNFDTRIGIWVGNPDGPNLPYQGDGSSGIYIYGAQLEEGSFPTSYIPSDEMFTSRASSATYIGSDGLIKTAMAYEPRYSYNPENLNVPPKLLLEGASTNLLTYSEDFSNAWWAKTRSQVTSNAAISPSGGNDATKLIANTVQASHSISTPYIPATENTTYTWSIYAKKGEYSAIRLRAATNIGFLVDTVVDLNTGARVIGTAPLQITSLPDGWFRIAFSATTPVGTTAIVLQPFVYKDSSTGEYAGDGTSGIYIWGAQLEEGYLSSYIPTSGTAVTRSADVYTSFTSTRAAEKVSISGKNFSEWYNQSEGTFVVSAYPMANYPVATNIFSVSNNSTNERIQMNFDANNLAVRMFAAAGGVNQVSSTFGTATLGVKLNASLAYKKDDWGASLNGGAVTKDTSGLTPAVDRIYLSANPIGTTTSIHLSRLAYYPRRLTNLELQAVAS